MKKLFVALAVMLLSTVLCAWAEEKANPPIKLDMFLGVWEAEDEPDLTIAIMPGSYTPRYSNWSQTDFYAEAYWRERSDQTVMYSLNVGSNDIFTPTTIGAGLLGLAFDSFKQIIVEKEDMENSDYSLLNYKEGAIDIVMEFEGETTVYSFHEITDGVLYLQYDEEGAQALQWIDYRDPHIYFHIFYRKTADAPSPEALSEGVVRPLLEMTGDTRLQTVMALIRFAAENQIAMVDEAQLAENLRAASDALDDSQARKFGANYDMIDETFSKTIAQTQNPDATGYNYPEFRNEDLEEEIGDLLLLTIDRYSAGLLCSALHTLVYGE